MNDRERKRTRARGYDYATPGVYFVTVCAQNRLPLFGSIPGDIMVLNDAGRMLTHWLAELERAFPGVILDEHIVMPNHVHCLLITESVDGVTTPGSLSQIVGWFKTMTTNAYIRGVKAEGWTPFPGKLRQRSFYDHIIRDDGRMDDRIERIRAYIAGNPATWHADEEYRAEGGDQRRPLREWDCPYLRPRRSLKRSWKVLGCGSWGTRPRA